MDVPLFRLKETSYLHSFLLCLNIDPFHFVSIDNQQWDMVWIVVARHTNAKAHVPYRKENTHWRQWPLFYKRANSPFHRWWQIHDSVFRAFETLPCSRRHKSSSHPPYTLCTILQIAVQRLHLVQQCSKGFSYIHFQNTPVLHCVLRLHEQC